MSDTTEPGSRPLKRQLHELFCLAIVSGKTREEAVVAAGFKAKADKSVRNTAATLMAREDVQDRIAFLRTPILEAAGITLQQHLDDLKALRDAAKQQGDFSPAIAAEVARGKASGFYVAKTETKIGLNGIPEGADLEFRVVVRKASA